MLDIKQSIQKMKETSENLLASKKCELITLFIKEKNQRFSNWIKDKNPIFYCLQDTQTQ